MVQQNVQNKAGQTGLHTHQDQRWKATGQKKPQTTPSDTGLIKRSSFSTVKSNASTKNCTAYTWNVHSNITVCGSIFNRI